MRAPFAIALLFGVFGVVEVASAGWIHAKAIAAQCLIARSWSQAQHTGVASRPWPWADMRPVARLSVPARGIDVFVLDSASPRALAFGPAHVGGTAMPGAWGNSVIVAHRDTHFAFLRRLARDDDIAVETANGARTHYRVRELLVVDQNEARTIDAGDNAQLTLVTCYPFDAVRPGSRLRYVVIATRAA